jgi:sterol O-acyltransferase
VGATATVISLLYMIIEHQINPVFLEMKNQTFIDSLMDLLLPFMCVYIMVFYLIFDCICNAFAELTCFADREFYGDWWNSASYGDFARLWNKPVHHFLLRHCYKESLENLKFSKKDAMLLTFLISSLMHELVFVLIGKKLRFYLFFLQMFQLPLIYLSSLKVFQGREIAGIVFFWFGMYLGPPLLAVAYLREYYA